MPKKEFETENDVKTIVKEWMTKNGAWHYSPTQSGFGVTGIHDHVACWPVEITEDMVGMTLGLFVSVESKRPGRRNEPRRGMTPAQKRMLDGVLDTKGASFCCDGWEDIDQAEGSWPWLTS